MLPPDLTRARKREGKLLLSALSPAERGRASEVAELLVTVTRASLGQPRDEVEAAWASVPVAAKERKLLLGLTHLVESRCEFSAPSSVEPEAVRRAVFTLAAERRAALPHGEQLGRSAVLVEVAAQLGSSEQQLEEALYADLRSAQRLERCALADGDSLVADYELMQVQSVLLRAERIDAEVRSARADGYRELFRKLKFRQLLYRIEPLVPAGYRLEIDGPLSLFGATTKYGLELALSLPALRACGSLRLRADLRWGKRRERLSFEQVYAAESRDPSDGGVRTEVLELLEAVAASGLGFGARLSEELLDLTQQGGGVLVPDLEVYRPGQGAGERGVLVEILGFWSRDAVFRRIEAVERGVSRPVLFVVSSRLRVSEALLEGAEQAKLYVYKGKINVHALLRKVSALLD
jgi:uncharacterized protein